MSAKNIHGYKSLLWLNLKTEENDPDHFFPSVQIRQPDRQSVRRTGWRGGSIGWASDSRSKHPRFEPCHEYKKHLWEFFPSPNLRLCWLAVGVPKPHVYTHAYEWSRTHAKDPVVHVRVQWITETRKDPACTCRTGYPALLLRLL